MEWRGNRIPRLVAGTAQLGMEYGISNGAGAPSLARATAVVEAALECGIRFFDTAQAYGESEALLGSALAAHGTPENVRIVSKLNPTLAPGDSRAIFRSVEESVEKLGGPLWAMLLHRPEWLGVWERGLGEALGDARRQGLVRYLGVSVYSADEARRALAHQAIDIVQVPANAWDQRILREAIFSRAAAQEKLCFARSVFLQGLLTLPAQAVSARLGFALPASERWHGLARRFALSPEALAVRCALALPAPLVVGMETAGQVRANAELFRMEPLSCDELDEIHTEMAEVLDDRILNPSRWKEAA